MAHKKGLNRPGFHHTAKSGEFKWKQRWKSFPTYRELKKVIKEYIENDVDDEIHVFRRKRGEWGEWFEIWQMSDGKPKIVKEGWC
jgi:hypothetical protein